MARSSIRDYLDSIVTPTFGLGLEFWLMDNTGIEIDGILVRKGHDADPGFYERSDGSFSEISFPLLLKARVFLDRDEKIAVSAFAGMSYSKILSEMDSNGVFPRHDFGLITGGEISKWFAKTGIFLDIRFDWGLKDLSIEYLPHRLSFKTKTLFITAGVKTRL